LAGKATDVAGNTTTTLEQPTIVVDATAPSAPTIALATDSGSSNSDNLTNDAALTVSAAAADVSRSYSVDGGPAAATYTAPTTEGSHTVVVTDLDTAGNTASASLTFTLDTTIATPTIALATDSGSSNSDNLTNDAALTVSAAAADVSRSYSVDGGPAAATYTAPTTEGSHTVVVTDLDTAGNTASASLTFTLDTTIATPTIALATDSGSSNSDNLTNDAALTVSAAAADVSRSYSVDGGPAAATYTAPTTECSHTVVVTDLDTAGNTASASLT